MIEHFVLLKARPGEENAVDEALAHFAAGIASLDALHELTWGRNFNTVSVDMGWTHGMLVRLTDRSHLPSYWDHESHHELVPMLEATCSLRFAIDYEIGPADSGPP